jgi:hypothetical protein
MASVEEVIDEASRADNSTPKVSVRRKDLLSFGSTLLNLAVADALEGGLLKGYYYYIWGDSDTLKTLLGITCFAETTINPEFAKYRIIFDNVEHGSHINTDVLFNEELGDRIEPPARDKDGLPRCSIDVEDFYYNLDDALKRAAKGEPFIYLLDSQDALDAKADRKHFDKNKKAFRKKQGATEDAPKSKDDEVTGSYGTAKAKVHSENIRRVQSPLYDTGSILIILGQSRDAINAMHGGRTRGGGRALVFYATVQIVTSLIWKIKKKVNDIDRKIGSKVKCEVVRSRLTGKQRTVEVDVYNSTGIDDLGSCVDYLVREGWWSKSKEGVIDAKEFKIKGGRDKLIRLIEKNNHEDRLRKIVGKCWDEVEEALVVKRKNRYAKN